jgi:hypothetical protein
LDCLVVCPACGRHIRSGETACPFCAADVTGIAMRCAKRTVSGEGLSRAALLALVAAGVDVTGCSTTPQADYGAPCAPPGCIWPGGFGGGDAGTSSGGYSTGGTQFVGGTGGTAGRTGTRADAAADSKAEAATDATSDGADATDAPNDDASPRDAAVKDQNAG